MQQSTVIVAGYLVKVSRTASDDINQGGPCVIEYHCARPASVCGVCNIGWPQKHLRLANKQTLAGGHPLTGENEAEEEELRMIPARSANVPHQFGFDGKFKEFLLFRLRQQQADGSLMKSEPANDLDLSSICPPAKSSRQQ